MDRFTEAFRTELSGFVKVVEGGPIQGATVADAVEVAWMAEAATESLRRGVPVTVESVREGDTAVKIAGAPISWGVCEVPGWGYQLTPDRVLTEMRDVGLTATELGPEGFLPTDPDGADALLDSHGLSCVGSDSCRWCCTTPRTIRCRRPRRAARCRWRRRAPDVVVLAAATGTDGYDARPVLDEAQWATLLGQPGSAGRHRPRRVACLAVLHPHVGTMVENHAPTWSACWPARRFRLCLDTGHLLIGGTDPLAARARCARADRARPPQGRRRGAGGRVQSGELTYTEAVRAGMYTPLGAGDVDIAGIVTALRDNGFDGWFVMEQDTILDGEPTGEGPVARRAWPAWRSSGRCHQRHCVSLRIGVARRVTHRRVGDRRPRPGTGPPPGGRGGT